MVRLSAPLSRFAMAVQDNNNKPLKIVALGSSSTAGTGASKPSRSYPARLQGELRQMWPERKVHVVNAGVGGQLARHMVARLDKDVLSKKPQLVLWQTGVNDAIRQVPIDSFKKLLAKGIERLQKAHIDVVLINHQYYPKFKKLKNGIRYIAAMRDIAQRYGVPVVQRFKIMQHLLASKQLTTKTMLSRDQFHLNDNSYSCLGKLVAQSLRSAAEPQRKDMIVEPAIAGQRL